MSLFSQLEFTDVRAQYDVRETAHVRLLNCLSDGRTAAFLDLLLGISDPSGNYSAAEHGLGPKILATNVNVQARLLTLADQFRNVRNAHDVPGLIRRANLKHLRIGVGSEMSCLLNPEVCWVANVKTIWAHLVQKHADNFQKADEELKLYREADASSEMNYLMWEALHAELAGSITRTAEEGLRLAAVAGVEPGSKRYLWADAMASQLYERSHP